MADAGRLVDLIRKLCQEEQNKVTYRAYTLTSLSPLIFEDLDNTVLENRNNRIRITRDLCVLPDKSFTREHDLNRKHLFLYLDNKHIYMYRAGG